MLVVVILFLSYPFWMKGESDIAVGFQASEEQERIDLEIEKQRMLASLAELELERSQGRLSPADHERLKATDEYRLAKILERIDQLSRAGTAAISKKRKDRSPTPSVRWAGALTVSGLVLVAASGLYGIVHSRIGLEAQQEAMQRQAQGMQGMPNPAEMVARLEARLRENPDDLQGQIMAGRSYMALNRLEDAKKAWSKVVALDRRNHEAHYHMGVLLMELNDAGDRQAYEKALEHFETALINVPREPAVLWYKGVALVHLGRYSEADDSWSTAVQNLPLGSEDADFVKEQLKLLRAGRPPLF